MQPFQPEPFAHLLQQFRAPALEAEDVAFVQPRHVRLFRIRLPENAADELRQGTLGSGVRQNRQDVGERTVPAFLQRLFRDDEPNRTLARQQAAGLVHGFQFVPLARLDRHVVRAHVGVPQQIVAGVVGVHHARAALLFARALDLNQTDGANVGAGFGFVHARRGFQPGAVLDRREQRGLPIRVGAVPDVQVEFDHLLRVQGVAANIDQYVRALGRGGRQLHDHARIESFERLLGVLAVRLVSLVEHDQRAEQPQGVAERGLRLPAPGTAAAREGVEIRHPCQQRRVSGAVVVRGEEAVEAAAVPEHAELRRRFPVGRRQHEHQHAKILPHVLRPEPAGFFQHQGPAGRGEVELLPVRMVAVLQCRAGLRVDLRGRHGPQHEPGPLPPVMGVDQIDDLGCQQGLAAAGRNFQAEGRQRFAEAVRARQIGPRGGRGLLPSLAHPVEVQVGIQLQRRGGLGAPFGQPFEKLPDGCQRAVLVVLEDHRASLSTVS